MSDTVAYQVCAECGSFSPPKAHRCLRCEGALRPVLTSELSDEELTDFTVILLQEIQRRRKR